MGGLLLALAAAAGWGSADFLAGTESRRSSALWIVSRSQAVGTVLALCAALAFGLPDADPGSLIAAAISGVALLAGLGTLYLAMTVGKIAVVAPIAAGGAVIPISVGIVSGDQVSAWQAGAIAAAVAGMILTSTERRASAGRATRVAAGAGLAVLAALGGGATTTLLDAASAAGVLWCLILQRATVATLATLVLRGRPVPPKADRRTWRVVALVGVIDAAATGCFVAAAQLAPLSQTATVAALYPVATVLLAATVLSERLARWQACGAALALAGVVVLSATSS